MIIKKNMKILKSMYKKEINKEKAIITTTQQIHGQI